MTRLLVASCVAGLAMAVVARAAEPMEVVVEPAELTKRTDLIGRSVTVEDRVRFFQSHAGQGYDELLLKRTPVVFRLPNRLRPETPPRLPCVRVHGTLNREGDQWFCDVQVLESLPKEIIRLNKAVASLPEIDFKGRLTWSKWAERLGKEFRDEELLERARELEGDAIRIEADRPAADQPQHWMTLAERARERHIAGAEAEALAHRALRARLKDAKTTDSTAGVLKQIEAFLPKAAGVRGDDGLAAKWQALYARDPAGAYRSAPPGGRFAFDHQLWADTAQRLLELQLADDPASGFSLAEKAETQLPDRPEVAMRFVRAGLEAGKRDLAKLRQRDVESLAKYYREKLHEPEQATALTRAWLNDQRAHRIGRTDAEGRIALANQFETLLADRETANALLREAWAIDPDSKELAEIFRGKGFRKVDGEWVDPSPGQLSDGAASKSSARQDASDNSLKNLTPQEVRSRLGARPSRVVRSASQGQVIEQWIYHLDRKTSYVNFRIAPELSTPTVVSYFTVDTPAPQRPAR